MSKCHYCGKKAVVGHAVSHAKNRTKRLFRPNIQKLRVLSHGKVTRVKLCTKCIKRLKKDGRMGGFGLIRHLPAKEKVQRRVIPTNIKEEARSTKEEIVSAPEKKAVTKVKKAEKAPKSPQKQEVTKPALKIEDIVGKKS